MDNNCRPVESGNDQKVEHVEIERFSQEDERYGHFDFVKYVQVDRCGVCGELMIWQAIWGDDFGVGDRFQLQGVDGRDLYHKAQDLIEKGELPPNIAVAPSVAAEIGDS